MLTAPWRPDPEFLVIGAKRGTGGSAGVEYLAGTLGKRAFPELWSLRTRL